MRKNYRWLLGVAMCVLSVLLFSSRVFADPFSAMDAKQKEIAERAMKIGVVIGQTCTAEAVKKILRDDKLDPQPIIDDCVRKKLEEFWEKYR